MGEGVFYPEVSGDDGWKIGTNNFGPSNSYAYIGSSSNPYNFWLRFQNVVIPNGALITSAFARFTAYQAFGNNTVNQILYFNDVDHAVAPTSISSFNGKVLTTASSEWNAVPAWTQNVQYDSPSVVSGVQEIVTRASFVSGNALMMMGFNNGSTAGAYRNFRTIDAEGGIYRPELHVEWIVLTADDDVASWNDLDTGSNIIFGDNYLTATHA